jgi:hypothetical protein
MIRRAFSILSALSLVLCLATCILWVRGYWIEDGYSARCHLHYISLASYCGEIGCEFGAVYGGGPQDLYTPTWVAGYRSLPVGRVPQSEYIHVVEAQGSFNNLPHYHDMLGFRWHPRTDRNWEYRERGIAVPAWSLVVLTGLLPVIRAWRPRRFRFGFCLSCGYDLRATPDRCPECGRCEQAKH